MVEFVSNKVKILQQAIGQWFDHGIVKLDSQNDHNYSVLYHQGMPQIVLIIYLSSYVKSATG